MKTTKLLFLCGMVLILNGCWNAVVDRINGLTLNKTSLELYLDSQLQSVPAGETFLSVYSYLSATIDDVGNTDFANTLRWHSDDLNVVAVEAYNGSSCRITAIGPGTTNVTVTSEDGNVSATCTVRVPSAYKWTKQTMPYPEYWQAIAASDDNQKILAARSGGLIYSSVDGGTTWVERPNAGNRSWISLCSSSDGTKVAACADRFGGMHIATSADGGATWSTRLFDPIYDWADIACNDDGSKLFAADNGGFRNDGYVGGLIWTSTDIGVTWTGQIGSGERDWVAVDSNSDGTKLIAGCKNENINQLDLSVLFISDDGGVTWIDRTPPDFDKCIAVTSNADGQKLAAVTATQIYTSTDRGLNWAARIKPDGGPLRDIDSSADGTKIVAVASLGFVFTSVDSGATWSFENRLGGGLWFSVSMSADGEKIAAIDVSNGVATGNWLDSF